MKAAAAEVPECHRVSISQVATNALHVALPPGKSMTASLAFLRRFGDIASISLLPHEEHYAIAVVYFDVRAAELAYQALGPRACRHAPQAGERAVRLPGDVQLDLEDCEGIADVQCDERSGSSYVVEFFDIRDAFRFQKAADPAVANGPTHYLSASPPGLGPALPAPLADAVRPKKAACTANAEAEPSAAHHRVVLEELPNRILSKAMMEATLQQAGLDSAVVQFSTHPGKKCPRGHAVVLLSSKHAAARCLHHFHGCSWDASGAIVNARIESVDCPASDRKIAKDSRKARGSLSAEAPAFVPAGVGTDHQVSSFAVKLSTTSETSTDVGESSELEDAGLCWPPGLHPSLAARHYNAI